VVTHNFKLAVTSYRSWILSWPGRLALKVVVSYWQGPANLLLKPFLELNFLVRGAYLQSEMAMDLENIMQDTIVIQARAREKQGR